MSKRVKLGFISAGGIMRCVHLPAAKKNAEVEMTAISDVNEQRVKEVAAEFGVARWYTDYQKMLESEKLDAVVIGTPNYLHAPTTIAALNAGCNVLVEKPMAMNAKECKKMIAAAKKSKKILTIGFQSRFYKETQILKQFIEKGDLGEIYYGKAGCIRRRGIPGWGAWFTAKSQSGGGPLIDIGVHILDVTLWLMGYPKAVSVAGSTYAKFGNRKDYYSESWQFDGSKSKFDVEDLACAIIKFENGASLLFETSWASNIGEEKMYTQLMGTEGGAEWRPLKIFREVNNVLIDIAPVVSGGAEVHHVQMKHFIESIQKGKQPITRAEHGLEVMQIIDAIYKSSETGKEVRIK